MPEQILRIVRDKARVKGHMASIAEWQSLRMQEYRYNLLVGISRFFKLFGVRRPVRGKKPAPAGPYENAIRADPDSAESFLAPYIKQKKPSLPVPATSIQEGLMAVSYAGQPVPAHGPQAHGIHKFPRKRRFHH